jgi:dTDP-glucose 4,6-dehydratase
VRPNWGYDLNLLVTGGAGFIGSNFVKMLLNDGSGLVRNIRVLDSLTYSGNLDSFSKEELDQFEFIKGDISDPQVVDRAMSNIEVIVNFAAETHVDRSINSASPFISSNILGVQNLLESSLNHDVQRFLQVSTDEVYGSIESGRADEFFLLKPSSPYSASKASAEMLCQGFFHTHKSPVIISRCSNNYGPFQHPEKLIPLAITNMLRGIDIPLYGTGLQVRNWIHVQDHCRALMEIISNGQEGQIYNIGGNQEMQNIEIIKSILQFDDLGQSSIKYVTDRKGHDFRYSLDASKIEKTLLFTPNLKFEEEIANVIEWYRQNKNWWESKVQ